jgi:two-component system sensor histidine kinase GlrK
MNLYRPKSVLRLVLIGFSLVTLPLILLLLNATLNVDRLVNQSQQAIFQAVQATKDSFRLLEHITAMERSARQYQVLGDKAIFEVYEKIHQEFQSAAKKLFVLPLNEAQRRLLGELVDKEQSLFDTLRDYPYNSENSKSAVSEFSALRDLTSFILSERSRLIDREIDSIQQVAERAKRILVWQLIAVGPVVLLFAAIFTVLISRPIRKIDQAIRQLGDGEFSSEIAITGPRDLEYLGKRLDWLRLRLIELEEQKNRFLSHVSHELKTPLTSIREGAELLADEVVGKLNENQRKLASILRENSIQLQKMIENLVNFRGVLLRHSALYVSPHNLNWLVEKVATDHQLAMMAKNIKLELCLTELVVSGDEDKLMIIIDNLLSNAVKFSPYGGIIKIILKQDGENAVLDVMDSGPGIDPADKDKIFDPFYQGQVLPQGYVKGTGIGLSVVAEYVRLHGGKIEIVDGEAKGAHFRVILPMQSR